MAKRSKSNWKPREERMAARAPRRRPWRIPPELSNWIITAGLVLLTAVAYAQVAGFEFTNYDDTAYVPDNPHVRDGFSLRGIGWACTTFETANWYPLTWLSLMLECQLFGPRPSVTHAVNALLHAASAVLLFSVLLRMTGRRWPSAAVAAVFAVHPLHVESVAWVAERKDVLSTLFFLLTLLAYCRYAARPGFGRWSLVFLGMAVGLLCKPMLVTLPFVLLLLDYWPLQRFVGWTSESVIEARCASEGRDSVPCSRVGLQCADGLGGPSYVPSTAGRIILEKLPLLALSVAAAVVTMHAQASMGATKMIGDRITLPLQLANAAVAYVKYLAMTFWPVDLAVFYPYDYHPRPALVAGSVALLVVVTAAAIGLLRCAPYLAVGWFWYLGTLVPTIGLVQVGAQGLADRYNYIPSIGICLAVVWLIADRRRSAAWQSAQQPRLTFAAGVCALVAILLVVAHRQVGYWANSEQLFRHALAVTGDTPESCENLGDTLLHHERYPEAAEQFRKVLELDAKQFRQTPTELAKALEKQERVDEAISCLRDGIRVNDDNAEAMNQLGMLLAQYRWKTAGALPEAIKLLEEASRLAPKEWAVAKNLAWIYATCPDHSFRNGPKAVEIARRACELTDSSNAGCLVALADAYLEIGDRERAIEELRAALSLNPKDKAIAQKLDKAAKDLP
jgi:tetratricopeptide (TPR) repeat protein